MDPAGVGIIIGVSLLVAFGIGMKVYDIYKQQQETRASTPLLSTVVRQHSKMNMLIPK